MQDCIGITFRLAVEGDIPFLRDLIAASVRGLCTADYTAEYLARAIGTALGLDEQLVRDRTYFVAEVEGTLVGCGGWSYRNLMYGATGGTTGETGAAAPLDPAFSPARIRAFFVHPEYARRGIGRQLLRMSEDAARLAGFRTLELVATRTGEPLYISEGYTPIEDTEIRLPDGDSAPGRRMQKRIT